jgi:hypothetical protein
MNKGRKGRLALIVCLMGTLLMTACLGCRPSATSAPASNNSKPSSQKSDSKGKVPPADLGD